MNDDDARRDRLVNYYDLMVALSEEHEADNACLKKGETGPKIILEWEDDELAIEGDHEEADDE